MGVRAKKEGVRLGTGGGGVGATTEKGPEAKGPDRRERPFEPRREALSAGWCPQSCPVPTGFYQEKRGLDPSSGRATLAAWEIKEEQGGGAAERLQAT